MASWVWTDVLIGICNNQGKQLAYDNVVVAQVIDGRQVSLLILQHITMLDFNKHETYNQLGLRQTQNIEYKIKHINTNKTYYAVNDSKSKD